MLELVLHVPPTELKLNVESAMRTAARAGRTVVRRRARGGGGLAVPKDGGRPLRRSGQFLRSLDVRRYRGVDRTGRGLTTKVLARFRAQPPEDRVVFLVVPTGRRIDRLTKGGRARRVTTNYGLGRVLAVPGKGRESVLIMFRSDAELRSVIRRAYAEALVAQLTRRAARKRST